MTKRRFGHSINLISTDFSVRSNASSAKNLVIHQFTATTHKNVSNMETNHLTNICKKQADQPPRCCSCGGEHTASHRKCPAYIQATILKAKKPTNSSPPNNPLTYQSPINTNNKTYSQIISTKIKSQYHSTEQHLSKRKNVLMKVLTNTIAKFKHQKTSNTLFSFQSLQLLHLLTMDKHLKIIYWNCQGERNKKIRITTINLTKKDIYYTTK